MLPLLLALTLSGQPVLLHDEPGAATDSETFLEVDTGADPNVLVVENDFWGTELFNVTVGNMRSLIVDLCPGPCGSNPEQLTRVGTRLVFLATDIGEEFPNQLWATDGTVGGTIKLTDGVDNTRTLVARLIPLGDQLLFMKGGDVWLSDGTRAGTAPAPWGNRRQLISASATATHRFIEVNDLPIDHCQLLVAGTDARFATALPMPNPAEHCAEPVATLGEQAVVSLTSGLWRFDATGVPIQIDSAPGARLTQVAGNLFFFRADATSLSLLRSTGEPGSTLVLSTLLTVPGVGQAGISGTRLLYSAANQAGVHHLYGSDGTVSGTEQVATLLGPAFGIMSVGPEAFVADGVADGPAEILETDGSSTGTSVLQGVFPFNFADRLGYRGGRGHSSALNLIALVVNELGAFRIRPGESPDVVYLKPANPIGSSPQPAILYGSEAFFTAGYDGPIVYRTDGTPDGSTVFTDGGLLGFVGVRMLVNAGNQVLSVSMTTGERVGLDAGSIVPQAALLTRGSALLTGDNPRILWRTDGTAAGTVALADLGPVTRFPAPLALGDGRVAVAIQQSIWFSDGTAAGTKSIAIANAAVLVELAGQTGAWVLSGATDQSTTLSYVTSGAVKDLKTWPPGQLPLILSANGDRLYALVRVGAGLELWAASPTAAEQKPATGLKSARAVSFFKSRVLVLGEMGAGEQLFEVGGDGKLTLLAPAPGATFLHGEGDSLFADIASPDLGLELHVYDEALHLFLPTGDLSKGVGSSSPSPPQKVGKHFLFSAWTPEAGREPWSWTPDPPPQHGCGCDAGPGAGALLGLVLLARLKRRAIWVDRWIASPSGGGRLRVGGSTGACALSASLVASPPQASSGLTRLPPSPSRAEPRRPRR